MEINAASLAQDLLLHPNNEPAGGRMKIGTTPYLSPQTTYRATRTTAGSTDGNQQTSGAKSSALDFTSMSRSDLRDTVNSLIKSGKLSLDDTTGLVGMMGPAVSTQSGQSGASTATYESSPFDTLSALRTAVDNSNARNDDASAASFMRSLTALQQLQGKVFGVDRKA
ncbi:hypothetical protein [Bradyrhizobium sp.]|uniref:hypothetical protein n=1 Tax=Bradyrhizobium sp. TaxID=376 RepID=UPI0039E46E81